MLTGEIQRILMYGSTVHVDCKKHSIVSLNRLAQVAEENGAMLVLEHCEQLSSLEKIRLAMYGRKNITFKESI
jgi:hypothetical protein